MIRTYMPRTSANLQDLTRKNEDFNVHPHRSIVQSGESGERITRLADEFWILAVFNSDFVMFFGGANI